MTISRAELKKQILSTLQLAPGYQGAYSDTAIDEAIQDSVDYIASKMFFMGDGWLKDVRYLDTTSGQVSIPIPNDIAIIDRVRYLVNTQYVPLNYIDDPRMVQWSSQSAMTQYPATYRIVQGKLYFNPALGEGGPQYLMLEGSSFPEKLRNDANFLPSQFHRGLQKYLKWRCCSILTSLLGKVNKEWQLYEDQWYVVMEQSLQGRVKTTSSVLDFDG